MYHFIYIVFFKLYAKQTGNPDCKEEATNMVLLTVFFHLFFLHEVIHYLIGYNILSGIIGNTYGKYVALPWIILIMVLGHKYYKRKGENVINTYNEKYLLTGTNIVLAFSIMFIPLVLGVIFLKNVH